MVCLVGRSETRLIGILLNWGSESLREDGDRSVNESGSWALFLIMISAGPSVSPSNTNFYAKFAHVEVTNNAQGSTQSYNYNAMPLTSLQRGPVSPAAQDSRRNDRPLT